MSRAPTAKQRKEHDACALQFLHFVEKPWVQRVQLCRAQALEINLTVSQSLIDDDGGARLKDNEWNRALTGFQIRVLLLQGLQSPFNIIGITNAALRSPQLPSKLC
jgi:hypothetical protein